MSGSGILNTNTQTPNIGFQQQAFGSNVNDWGNYENSNWAITDSQLGGTLNVAVSGAQSVIITDPAALNLHHVLTGVLTGNIQYIVPNLGRRYLIDNQTTGGFSVTVIPLLGNSGTVVPPGQISYVLVNPGNGPGSATAVSIGSSIALPVSVMNGGTGQTTAAGITSILVPFAGDSGSGGVQGVVPAPPAGSSADNYVLLASGLWGAAPTVSPTPVPGLTFSGNATNSPALPANVSVAQLTSVLLPVVGDTGSGGTQGVVPAPAAGYGALGYPLLATGSFGTIANSALNNMAVNTFKGNISGSAAAPSDLTTTQVTGALSAFAGDTGTGGVKGMVPAPPSGSAAAGDVLLASGVFGAVPVTSIATFVGDTGSGGTKGIVPAPSAGTAAQDYALLASGVWGPSATSQVSIQLTALTLTAAMSGRILTNSGITTAVNYTLPTPSAGGAVFGFFVSTAKLMTIHAPAGVTIYAGNTSSSAGGSWSSQYVGGMLRLRAIDSATYAAETILGMWNNA